MSQKTRYQLQELRDSLIRSGGIGGKTTADDIRQFETAIIESLTNILDDKDQPEGYLGIDEDGIANVSKIKQATPEGKYLNDSGLWSFPLKSGNKIVNGDGVTTTFQVTHGFGAIPSGVFITPLNEDSAALNWVENIDVTKFDIVFKVAPAAGVLNVRFKYLVV